MEKKAKYNSDVIECLMQKHNVKRRFIQLSLKGERTSERALTIKEDYRVMIRELKKTLEQL